MKNKISAEFEKIKSIKSNAELYLVFFRLVQLISGIGLVFFLGFVMFFMANAGAGARDGISSLMGPVWIAGPVILNGAQIVLAEFALQAVGRKQFWGTAVGLMMSALMLSPWSFVIAVFGFYCFLNANFQRKYLENSPEFFRNILSTFNLNRIDAVKAE